jgi:IclR family transcriptional regulator, acetate operon repressor
VAWQALSGKARFMLWADLAAVARARRKADGCTELAVRVMKSLLKSLEVLEAVAEMQPVGVSELARRLDLPKTTTQRILQTFATTGWLRPVGGEATRWQIGHRVLRLQVPELQGGQLYVVARKPMQELRDQVNETVHLSILDGLDAMLLIDRVDCTQNVRTFSPIGDRSPIHATAIGTAVMAYLAPDEIDAIIQRGLTRYTENTITDPEALRTELDRVRERGYSLNLCCYRPAVCAIGAAILDSQGRPVGGLCISMPASRYVEDNEKIWGGMVNAAARKISIG